MATRSANHEESHMFGIGACDQRSINAAPFQSAWDRRYMTGQLNVGRLKISWRNGARRLLLAASPGQEEWQNQQREQPCSFHVM
jgi:hypothetical protein